MIAKDVLDGLSDTLLRDKRILSVPERELLINLVHRARVKSPYDAASETITQLVGEIVAERAYGILGDSIVQRLLTQSTLLSEADASGAPIWAGTPGTPPPGPGDQPGSRPQPPGPGPPSANLVQATMASRATGTAVMEIPDFLPAQCVVLDEFLAPTELNALTQYALDHEGEFKVSEVISPGISSSKVDFDHRRSRVLMDLGRHEVVIVDHLRTVLDRILARLGHESFRIADLEAQITASNQGDFFRWHTDNAEPSNDRIAGRKVTFVYFFHREPKQFQGGELRIYDSVWKNNTYAPSANYRCVIPEQNQMVVFRSSLVHEITPVECPSRAFADSRFTVNGWLH